MPSCNGYAAKDGTHQISVGDEIIEGGELQVTRDDLSFDVVPDGVRRGIVALAAAPICGERVAVCSLFSGSPASSGTCTAHPESGRAENSSERCLQAFSAMDTALAGESPPTSTPAACGARKRRRVGVDQAR